MKASASARICSIWSQRGLSSRVLLSASILLFDGAASCHSARWGSGKYPTSSKAARGELLSPAHSVAQFERAALNTSIMAQSGQAPPRALPCAHRRPQVIAIQHLWCEMPRIERTVPRRRSGRVDDDSANAFSHRQSWLGTSLQCNRNEDLCSVLCVMADEVLGQLGESWAGGRDSAGLMLHLDLVLLILKPFAAGRA